MTAWERRDLFAIESLTNERGREELGAISRVRPEDRVVSPGATPIVAAFAHAGDGRLNDSTFEVYYAAFSEPAAIAETRFGRERFPGVTDHRTSMSRCACIEHACPGRTTM